MTTIDLYDVLLVEPDCTINDIKEAYKKLAQKYHPDKKGGDVKMFELITHAYNELRNPKTRSQYDKMYKISKQSESSHLDLKSGSRNYFESMGNTKKNDKDAEIDFDTIFAEMDKKHGFVRDSKGKIIDNVIDIDDKVKDLETIRDHDDIENIPEKIFNDGEEFEQGKFNTRFDALFKTQGELIIHDGNPIAWNVLNEYGAYGSIDNYESLYAEDNDLGGVMFGSVKFGDDNTPKNLTKKELNKMGDFNDYTFSHNHKEDNYNQTLEERMNKWKDETSKFDNREMGDFDTSDNCGGYGVFGGLGITFDEYKNGGLLSGDTKRK